MKQQKAQTNKQKAQNIQSNEVRSDIMIRLTQEQAELCVQQIKSIIQLLEYNQIAIEVIVDVLDIMQKREEQSEYDVAAYSEKYNASILKIQELKQQVETFQQKTHDALNKTSDETK